MRLLIPIPGIVAVGSVAEIAAFGGAWLLDQPDAHNALLSVVAGIATAIPIVTAIAIWFARDHFALKDMHAANCKRLDRIIDAVEGSEGLIADRKTNRERRHEHGNILQVLTLRLQLLERHNEKATGYEVPRLDDVPSRRRGDPHE